MSQTTPYCDYNRSAQRLAARLRRMRESEWSPTPRVKELRGFAEHLENTADLLDQEKWIDVQALFDADPPPEIGLDGYPITPADTESRLGSYSALKWELRDLAEVVRQEAKSYPDPRARPEVPYGAIVFLHLWYQAEKERPTLYDDSEAVQAFSAICQEAGIFLSATRLRTALGAALREFDPLSSPPGLEFILVESQ